MMIHYKVCEYNLKKIKTVMANFVFPQWNNNICMHGRALDCTTVAVSGKVWGRLNSLTIPVRWLSLLQLTILNGSAIVVLSKFLVAILCCHFAFFNFLFIKGLVIGMSQISSFFPSLIRLIIG